VFVNAPTTCRICEVADDHLGGVGEGVVAFVDGNPHAVLAEPNDVVFFVPRHICEETNVFGCEPPSCILCKILDDKEGLDVDSVTEDNDTIETKTNYVSEAGAGSWYRQVLGDNVAGHFEGLVGYCKISRLMFLYPNPELWGHFTKDLIQVLSSPERLGALGLNH
jgi:hypothetical protein